MANPRDHEQAHAIAIAAGEMLLQLRADNAPDWDDADATKALAKLADRASDDFIIERLQAAFPDDAILSEETEDNFHRLEANRVWIIDPVDGTWEYSHNRSDFAVHVALWERAQGLTAGTVAIPATGEIWSTHTERTVSPDVQLPTDRDVRVVVSRTRPLHDQEQFRLDLAHALAPLGVPGVTLLQVGSVGAKVGEVLAGRADAYVSESGFYEWDGAAPAVAAMFYGLQVTHIDGTPHTYNNESVKMRSYIATRTWLAEPLQQVLVARQRARQS